MRISAAFPSQYLKAADLLGKRVKVVMSHVAMEDIGGDHKPVLYFIGKEKGLVLNKTNANNIAGQYGDDTDHWSGQTIELVETMVDFQGRTVPAIRVYVQRGAMVAVAAPRPAPPSHIIAHQNGTAAAPVGTVIDDEVPF
jgi:arabinogalactan endo-1,4-beta-galactosidase